MADPLYIPPTANVGGVDPRLVEIAREAAARFPLKVAVTPSGGKNGRKSGTRNHPGGFALDFQIYNDKGKPLGNYRDPKSYRMYELFAQTMKQVQSEKYPELDKTFRWGGYFGGKHAFDQMHVDITPRMGGATAMGDWKGGLNDIGRRVFPASSIGIKSYDLAALGGSRPTAVAANAAGHGGTPSAMAFAGVPSAPRPNPALDAVNSFARGATPAMAYAPTAPRMVGGAPPPYAVPTSTVGHAAMPRPPAPSTHRPSLPMTPAGASSVVGAGVPTASVVGSGFKPGSWLQQSFRVPVDYGVSAGVGVPKSVPPPGILPTAPKLAAAPVGPRPVAPAPAPVVNTPHTIPAPASAAPGLLGLGILPRIFGPGPLAARNASLADHTPRNGPLGLGILPHLFGGGGGGGLFGGGGILGSLFGGSAGGGKGSPTGGPSGGGYTGLFTGSNPFIRGNATEPQMTTAQYQAMNPGPWSSPSSKKR